MSMNVTSAPAWRAPSSTPMTSRRVWLFSPFGLALIPMIFTISPTVLVPAGYHKDVRYPLITGMFRRNTSAKGRTLIGGTAHHFL